MSRNLTIILALIQKLASLNSIQRESSSKHAHMVRHFYVEGIPAAHFATSCMAATRLRVFGGVRSKPR